MQVISCMKGLSMYSIHYLNSTNILRFSYRPKLSCLIRQEKLREGAGMMKLKNRNKKAAGAGLQLLFYAVSQ